MTSNKENDHVSGDSWSCSMGEYFGYFKLFRQQPDWRDKEVMLIVEKLEFEADDIAEDVKRIVRAETEEKALQYCKNSMEKFCGVRKHFEYMQQVIPAGSCYKYRYKVKFILERLICLLSSINFLGNSDFMDVEEVAKLFGVLYGDNDTLFDLETYLIGLLQMADELTHICMKDIINGQYVRPKKIMAFLKDINEGFLLLNFKNDYLRRKYDGLKYHIKQVEVANDDILMHGLLPQEMKDQEVVSRDIPIITVSETNPEEADNETSVSSEDKLL